MMPQLRYYGMLARRLVADRYPLLAGLHFHITAAFLHPHRSAGIVPWHRGSSRHSR